MADRQWWLDVMPVGDGWKPLVLELHERLVERWPNYEIDQIKEKFGGLRFYADPCLETPDFPDDVQGIIAHNAWYEEHVGTFQALISEYEWKSETICEVCGQPGKNGDENFWWSTRCPEHAPAGWVAGDVDCPHESITNGTCDGCGRTRVARLEHSDEVLFRTHPFGECWGDHCTLHRMSDHAMRAFPQQWRSDRQIMERVCPHGVGHPDPDEYELVTNPEKGVHGCDGCCRGGA
jgi:hypothetical protein